MHSVDISRSRLVVTGGSQGIGAAVAAAAALRGARVGIVARRAEPLRAHAAAIGASAHVADVTDAAALREVFADTPDIVVHCAGAALPGRFTEVDADEFSEQLSLNYLGAVNVLRAVLPGMLARGSGTIVLTSSTAALLGVPGYTAYAASKAAVASLAATLRTEVEPCGVRVIVLYPPDTDTPGFAAENLRKPPETAAVSGGIARVKPEVVARAVLRGIERGRRTITVDTLTRLLLVAPGVIEPVLRPILRRTAARALR